LLAAYCEACALQERAAGEMGREDADPSWLTKWQAATKVMSSLAPKLKICPQTAGKGGGKPLSYYERMALEEADAEN
jgi:hypothetical protein